MEPIRISKYFTDCGVMSRRAADAAVGRWFRVILSTFTSIGPMLIYLVGGILMIRYNQDLTIGDISVLVALLGRMYMPVNSLLNIQVDWMRAMALFSRIFDYFDIPVEIEKSTEYNKHERLMKYEKANSWRNF
mgnify:CR=1 FL=1